VVPHLRLEINFGETGELERGISLKSLSSDLEKYDHVKANSTQTIMIQMPGVLLKIVGGETPTT